MSKKSIGQIMSIIQAISTDNNVTNQEIKWLRKEIKNWFFGIFDRFKI